MPQIDLSMDEAQDENRPTKRPRLDYTQNITVLVGDESTPIVVHKNILCRSSRFFEKACKGEWIESKNKTVDIPEHTEEVFLTYTHWLYTGELDLVSKDDGRDDKGDSSQEKWQRQEADEDDILHAILECYILGDFLGDARFKNDLMNKLVKPTFETRAFVHSDLIARYWDKLPKGSHMRRLLVHLMSDQLCRKSFHSQVKTWPSEFFEEVALRWMMASKELDPYERDLPQHRGMCHYHEHDGEGKCALPKKKEDQSTPSMLRTSREAAANSLRRG